MYKIALILNSRYLEETSMSRTSCTGIGVSTWQTVRKNATRLRKTMQTECNCFFFFRPSFIFVSSPATASKGKVIQVSKFRETERQYKTVTPWEEDLWQKNILGNI